MALFVTFPALVRALNTSLRRGELAGRRWNQVDLEGGRLTFGRVKIKAGSGRKVPLNEGAFAALSAWARQFPFRRPEHFVFPSEKYWEGGAVYDVDPSRASAPSKWLGERLNDRQRIRKAASPQFPAAGTT